MSELARLQSDLQEVSAAIARAERTLAAYPDRPSVLATLRTIEKRREILEEQFLATAAELGFDACSYRIELPQETQATISGLTGVLGSFQRVFTSVYDAIVHGPKQRARASAGTIDATAFRFAYSYPGSVGIMMTLRRDANLFDESQLERAVEQTFQLLKATEQEQVEALVETVGLPAVRQAHAWALENAKAGFGADIAWKPQTDSMTLVRIQPQEAARLATFLGSAISRETITAAGNLLHVDYTEKTFRMEVDGEAIHGTFDDAISRGKPAHIPWRYIATLNVSTKVAGDEEEEEKTYFLVRLESESGGGASLPDLSAS
jgi:hypothetical protein